jgi:RNA polymerase sigma-70 factor (ECF subfamily)
VFGVDALTRCALAAQNGDRSALDRLVEATYEQVWRLCAKLVDVQCADDLAQDTFVRTVGALPKFRGDASARTWLLTIARNTCMDELRTRTRQRRRDAALAERLPTHRLMADDVGQEVGVADVLERLAPERKEAFILTQLLGLSYREASEVCSCPPGTIRSRVARARADLIAILTLNRNVATSADGGYDNVTSMYPITRHMTS